MTKESRKSPAELNDFFKEIESAEKREKIKLPPELVARMQAFARRLQDKLMAGKNLTEADLAPIKGFKEEIELYRFGHSLEKQLPECFEVLRYFELIQKEQNPAIKAIDGQTYPAPTPEEVHARLTLPKLELIRKHLKDPLLMVVPFGLPLFTIATRVGAKNGALEWGQNPIHCDAELCEADLPLPDEKLFYYPERFGKNHGGYTKTELLADPDQKFAWSLVAVDGSPLPPKQVLFRPLMELFREFSSQGITGLTPEEWLVLHARGVFNGELFERQHYCGHLAALFVDREIDFPGSDWSAKANEAGLTRLGPRKAYNNLGARRAMRF